MVQPGTPIPLELHSILSICFYVATKGNASRSLIQIAGGSLLLLGALLSSENLFAQWGFGPLGALAASLGYSLFAIRRTLRRRRERKARDAQRESGDSSSAGERSEWTRDFALDLFTAGVPAFLANWMYPASPLFIEMGRLLEGWALVVASGVFGFAGLAFLHEGMARLWEYRKAKKELRAGGLGGIELGEPGPGGEGREKFLVTDGVQRD